MPSPFPGMDPYLEGEIWPDVHQRLATAISERLARAIRPHYVARLAIKTIHDDATEDAIHVIYPDVEIVRRPPPAEPMTPFAAQLATLAEALPVTPAISLPVYEYQQRMVTVEIYWVEGNELVTCIEVLSPANKRGFGLRQYRQKRQRLHNAKVHLLEIDLIRRGQRPVFTAEEREPSAVKHAPYLVTLWRAGRRSLEAWPIHLPDRLPVVAVPLREPDPDVPLDLAGILATIYDVAGYDLSIDYTAEPALPPLDEATTAWLHHVLHHYRQPAA